ncbi:gustatory receptor-like 36a [Drosophila kikkawai]|uniref:Gustatory receptor-like 36a n=1 Tax=Drosophila kikkawai TaxID=30033 RepID=A0A6P4IAX2_DROKI|nr:uncharacterized protein CG31750-like [Drosophila kikkawai]
MALPVLQQCQKIRQILHLYSRISNAHQDIIVLWLPVANVLFSNVVMMMGHWASIINVVLYNHDLDTAGKWNWVLKRHLGGALGPLLKILLIGLCNDRLAQLDRRLSLQLLLIDLRLLGDGDRSHTFAKELTILLRAQPLRNPIMCKHQICDSPFVLEFVFCVLVNALSYVQYGMSMAITLDFQSSIRLMAIKY